MTETLLCPLSYMIIENGFADLTNTQLNTQLKTKKNQKEIVRGAQMLNESTPGLDWDKLQPWHSGADRSTSIIAQLLGGPRWIQTTQSLIPTILQSWEKLY